MARPSSTAVAGYYPAPPPVIAALGALLRPEPPVLDEDGDAEERALAIVDPCAAEGAAMLALAAALAADRDDLETKLYACEMEETRFAKLKGVCPRDAVAHHGDAFRLQWEREDHKEGASVLLLNPPYDEGKLEARWLARFTGCLAQRGVLALLVPFSALPELGATLAQHYTEIACYRFPPGLFEGFRQVAVLARRTASLLKPNPALLARIEGWATDLESLPILSANGSTGMIVPVFKPRHAGFSDWHMAPLDLVALMQHVRPWWRTDRRGALLPIPGILPEGGPAALVARTFPTAMPLGEGHVPATLACGVFNGARVAPDDPALNLPDIYAKAVFRKTWRTKDQKKDKYGQVIGEVQVQQPELVMTVLDLAKGAYHRPLSSVTRTGARQLGEMTAADLLVHYREGFRRVLRERCPALVDPANPAHVFPLPELPRALFTAQATVTRVVVRLLETVGAALVLGQVGTGKSTVALAAAQTLHAQRVVVVCPPHLLDSWGEQVGAVVPWARTMVMSEIGDVDAFATAPDKGMVIGILPETAGKLSHAWEGIEGACPRCGEPPHESPATLAEKRLRCTHRPLRVRGAAAQLARDLAVALLPVFADQPAVTELVPGRGPARLAAHWEADLGRGEVRAARWARCRSSGVLPGLVRAMARRLGDPTGSGLTFDEKGAMGNALLSLLAALDDPALTASAAREVYATAARVDRALYATGWEQRTFARRLMLLLPLAGEVQTALAAELRALGANDARYGDGPWDAWEARLAQLQGRYRMHRDAHQYNDVEVVDGGLRVHKRALGDPHLALEALGALKGAVVLGYGHPCGEPLFQAVPRPRCTPLAAYLTKRYPGVVDLVIVDEAHQFTNQDSAAGLELAQFMGTKMILLTGSISNGYAVGLFAILWCISKKFRERFARDEIHDFGRMFGYLRRYVDCIDRDTGEIVAYGKSSDRVERRRTVGYAPGILPSLLLLHVLPVAAVLLMKDLEVDLPPRSEVVELLEPGEELGRRVRALRATLMEQIREDRGTDLAGKLFGAMGEEWSSADRASLGIGNGPDGVYRARYPEAVGGQVVAELDPMPPEVILPKERRLLDIVKSELAEDRPVLVFVWHSHCGLFERLARLILAETGEAPVLLESEKVPAKKREAWLKREVIAKGRRVMICNPAAVETGLNCLTHFCTLVWFQPPDCDPRAKRQAEGRVYRLGQDRPVRIFWLLYKGTSQEVLHRLLLLKVAESDAVDGLDPTSALQASGVGAPVGMTGFDLGRAIFEVVDAEEKVRLAPPTLPTAPLPWARALPLHAPAASEPPLAPTVTPPPEPPPSAALVPVPRHLSHPLLRRRPSWSPPRPLPRPSPSASSSGGWARAGGWRSSRGHGDELRPSAGAVLPSQRSPVAKLAHQGPLYPARLLRFDCPLGWSPASERSRRTEAGSSLGSWGTSLPRKALARMAWSSSAS